MGSKSDDHFLQDDLNLRDRLVDTVSPIEVPSNLMPSRLE